MNQQDIPSGRPPASWSQQAKQFVQPMAVNWYGGNMAQQNSQRPASYIGPPEDRGGGPGFIGPPEQIGGGPGFIGPPEYMGDQVPPWVQTWYNKIGPKGWQDWLFRMGKDPKWGNYQGGGTMPPGPPIGIGPPAPPPFMDDGRGVIGPPKPPEFLPPGGGGNGVIGGGGNGVIGGGGSPIWNPMPPPMQEWPPKGPKPPGGGGTAPSWGQGGLAGPPGGAGIRRTDTPQPGRVPQQMGMQNQMGVQGQVPPWLRMIQMFGGR